MENPIAVTVEILGKEYRIACAEDEKDALLASARYLDEKMSDVKGDGKVVGSERVAVVVALNIAHELLQQKFEEHDRNKLIKTRLRGLQERIEVALDESPQLPI